MASPFAWVSLRPTGEQVFMAGGHATALGGSQKAAKSTLLLIFLFLFNQKVVMPAASVESWQEGGGTLLELVSVWHTGGVSTREEEGGMRCGRRVLRAVGRPSCAVLRVRIESD